MKKPVAFFWLMMVVPLCTIAQKQANNWKFGNKAGIDFNSGSPVFSPSSITAPEGCSSFSDSNGKLLFYTNGSTVWNRNNGVMPGGTGLAGDPKSTESALITNIPNDNSRYYIFTLDKEGRPNGLQYSVVDMNRDGGLGDITEKNIPLTAPVCEKFTAVKHRNANDIWLIAHRFGSDEFYVYLITCRGINTTPMIFHTGSDISSILSVAGYMKVSPDSKKLASAVFDASVELFDFNDETGSVSNGIIITSAPNNGCGPYGLEFSPDSKLLYVSEVYNCDGSGAFKLLQYDLTSPDIVSTRITLDSGVVGPSTGMLIGPDKRIYVSYDQMPYAGTINAPNVYGAGCNLVKNTVPLQGGATCGAGIPNFVSGLDKTLLGNDTSLCISGNVTMGIDLTGTNYSWNTGSTDKFITVAATGKYVLSINTNNCIYTDTVSVNIQSIPTPALGPDREICPDQEIILDPATDGLKYTWQDGSVSPTFTATAAGTYNVLAENACGSGSDEVVIREGHCPQMVPNAFTPGKATNSLFKMANVFAVTGFRMQVFNRWGQRVYYSNVPVGGWNGTSGGAEQPAGVYVYEIRFSDPLTGKPAVRKGTVLLIR
jgi:gliding motility-associated-like protein